MPLSWEKQQEGYIESVRKMRWKGSGDIVCVRQIMKDLLNGKDFGFYSKFDGMKCSLEHFEQSDI